MTDEQARALGERWIRAGGGWPSGALVFGRGTRVLALWTKPSDPEPPRYTEGPGYIDAHEWDPAGLVPDPRDPATLGVWLAVVRERWSDPYMITMYGSGVWFVYGTDVDELASSHSGTEAEALVAALEAAPRPER